MYSCCKELQTCRCFRTANECVTLVARETTAEGRVVDDVTLGVLSAALLAGIAALLLDTSLVVRALLAHDTLGTTERRTSHVVGAARAHRSALLHLADGV